MEWTYFAPPASSGRVVFRPPFRVRQALDVDAKQGEGSGIPAFKIEDQDGHHIALAPNVAQAQVVVMWCEAIYASGRERGEEAARRSVHAPAIKRQTTSQLRLAGAPNTEAVTAQ